MAFVDDTKLIQLATHRPQPIFLVLNRARAIRPLILLLVVLPSMIILVSQPLSNSHAIWSLHALETYLASDFEQVMIRGSHLTSIAPHHFHAEFEPPLATWFTAGVMSILGPAHPFSPVAVNYLSTSAAYGMAFLLFARLLGPRVGFWTVLLLVIHPVGLTLVRAPAPVPLTLCLTLIAFWGILRHREKKEGIVSFPLLFAGVSLGLGIFSGGLVIVVSMALVALLFTVNKQPHSGEWREGKNKDKAHTFIQMVVGFAVVLLSAFAMCGWWLQMMHSQFGAEFRDQWNPFSLTHLPGNGNVSWSIGDVVSGYSSLLGILGFLSLVGWGCFVRDVFRFGSGTSVPGRKLFVLVWTGLAFALWGSGLQMAPSENWRHDYWEFFLLIPCIGYVAFVIDEILQRRMKLPFVVLIVILSPCSYLVIDHWDQFFADRFLQQTAVDATIAIVSGIAGLLLIHFGRKGEPHTRFVIGGLVLGIAITSLALGIGSVSTSDDFNELELKKFMKPLEEGQQFEGVLLISGIHDSPRLVFAVRSRWPHVPFEEVKSWDAAFRSEIAKSLQTDKAILIVEWLSTRNRPTKIESVGFEVQSLAAQRYFYGKELRAFDLRRGRQSNQAKSSP
ncbi:MAG: hypothetical protein Tsb009_02540 [Planctomycetaceae bacterium]